MSAPLLALLMVALASCSSDPTTPEPPGECGVLSELQCINSGVCTLEFADPDTGTYLCRDAADSCEQGFRQRTDTAATCTERGGCRFVPGFCYCPPDVVCVCGGGPPPTCEAVPS